MKRTLITACLTFITLGLSAQQTIESVLSEIEKNNKSIIAERQKQEAMKLSYRTGLNPENPKIEYERLPGRPDGAGTQQDLTIMQVFDFPTSYTRRRNVSQELSVHSDLQFQSFRQEILLEAKLLCIDFVHADRLNRELTARLDNANRLLTAITKKTEQGESNILDLNKVKLLQLDIKAQMTRNQTDLNLLRDRIVEMNGGEVITLGQLQYPQRDAVPNFEVLDSLIESNDPVVKVVRQEAEITNAQLALTRSMILPKPEVGYHQQSILGQKYAGVHVGMTIPLWEGRNKVKTSQANLSYNSFRIQEHRNEHYYRNKQLYSEYVHWQSILDDYRTALAGSNNDELLGRALNAGQMSVIEYLMEVRYFYDAISQSLDAERQLNRQLSMLYKFQL